MKKRIGSIAFTCFLIIMPAVIIAMILLSAIAVSNATAIINADTGDTMSAGLNSGVEFIEKELAKNRKISEALAAATRASYGVYKEPNFANMLVGIVETNASTFGGGIWFEPFKFTDLREYFSPYCMRSSSNEVEYMNNYSLGDGVYYNTQDWYTSVVNSKETAVWSAPYYDDFAKKSMITSSSPIYSASNVFIGAATADIDLTSMQDMVHQLETVDGSHSLLIDSTGLYVADIDPAKQFTMNIADDPNTTLASLGAEMLASDSGSGSCVIDGKKCMAWYQTVPEIGWKLCTIVPEDIVYGSIETLRIKQLFICIIAILLLCVLIYFTIYGFIIVPIKQVCETSAQIAAGNLNINTKKIHARHEIKTLVELNEATVERLRMYDAYISETASVISDIGDGKLEFSLTHDYTGDFSKLKSAMLRIQTTLKDTMSAMIVASEQVLLGSRNISAMASNLADSNAEQAMAVDRLSSTISEISQTIHETAENSQKADKVSEQVSQAVVRGNEQMQSMVSAMAEISSSSDEIGKIIKTIDDIAFQTNILALNAAVEAARAGEAGKGFAVVADEVRNLAQKSADAAKNTTGLIENSLRAVSGGSKIARDTASSLTEISANANESIKLIGEIARVSGEQAESIAVVSSDLQEINRVVQTNSAAAQESSAAGTDLMNQADTLKQLADHFRLS